MENEKNDQTETNEETASSITQETPTAEEKTEKESKKKKRETDAQLLKCKEELEKAQSALKESEDKYLRLLAEYDNFRKRTVKEKESIYSDAYGDALKEILPIIDTLEMAAGYSGDKVSEGVKMTLAQFVSTLEKLGIEEIKADIGGEFDPELHNAVMSADNPELPSGSIAAVLRKGYKKGDKVYRYTMVSVVS